MGHTPENETGGGADKSGLLENTPPLEDDHVCTLARVAPLSCDGPRGRFLPTSWRQIALWPPSSTVGPVHSYSNGQ